MLATMFPVQMGMLGLAVQEIGEAFPEAATSRHRHIRIPPVQAAKQTCSSTPLGRRLSLQLAHPVSTRKLGRKRSLVFEIRGFFFSAVIL